MRGCSRLNPELSLDAKSYTVLLIFRLSSLGCNLKSVITYIGIMGTCYVSDRYFVCGRLHQQYMSYGPACCLAKRWMSAQLLDPHHFPEMCVELLVASLYLMPEPYQPPNQPQLGFFRFLHLLAHTNWNSEPVILNLNSEMTSEFLLGVGSVMLPCVLYNICNYSFAPMNKYILIT